MTTDVRPSAEASALCRAAARGDVTPAELDRLAHDLADVADDLADVGLGSSVFTALAAVVAEAAAQVHVDDLAQDD